MAESTLKIEHVIPHLGPTIIPLYPPADKLYSLLLKCNETERLKALLHLGALSEALPGARHARWDYTVSLLYYAQALKLRGMNSAFTLGRAEFSSAQAALQTIALCWNIGHLPGTFLVEKGVYRWLHETGRKNPANELKWPKNKKNNIPHIRKQANRFLREQDYLGVARVLAVIKLLFILDDTDNELCNVVFDFAVRFLLSYEKGDSKQWYKLSRAFTIVRHLAYLTIDISLAGLEWCPSIPSLLRQEVNREGTDLQELSDRIGEVLSPIERLVYTSLYHRETSRKEAAIVADWVYKKLMQSKSARAKISTWMKKGDFGDLRIGDKPASGSVEMAGSIRLRTHFVGTDLSPVEIELLLRRKNFVYPLALNYQAWNSEAMIEPDELIIDGIVRQRATSSDVGRLLAWMIGQFESPNAGADARTTLLVLHSPDRHVACPSRQSL